MKNEIRETSVTLTPAILIDAPATVDSLDKICSEEELEILISSEEYELLPTIADEAESFRLFDGEEDSDNYSDEELSGNTHQSKALIEDITEKNSLDLLTEFSAQSVQHQTKLFNDVSMKQNSKVYSNFKAFMELDPKLCEPKDLKWGLQLYHEFVETRVMVRTSAVGLATHWKIQEGRLIDKVLEINDAVGGVGREEFAKDVFPYPKSTRCMYTRISTIKGVDSYTFLGTECLRKVATAIEKTEIQGPDQIKALFERFDEECDLGIGHKKFKEKLKSILERVLNSNDDGRETAPSTPAEPEGNDEEAEPSTPAEADEEVAPSTPTEADKNDEEAVPSTPSKPDEGATGRGSTYETGKPSDEMNVLDEDSVNSILAKFNSAVRGLLKRKPPKEAFDLILFEKAKGLLEELESYVKGESVN